eukprot:TRINITY_DN5962_c0_g1_i1.p1 TRINITY_DN5962_c0_g1~~TRINITY_DN5962_c0_g1_i1.p1  ORF type:complete len:299 (-),score=81.04 TRINITY_DN5962_c0_g1_i1:127-897(-)
MPHQDPSFGGSPSDPSLNAMMGNPASNPPSPANFPPIQTPPIQTPTNNNLVGNNNNFAVNNLVGGPGPSAVGVSNNNGIRNPGMVVMGQGVNNPGAGSPNLGAGPSQAFAAPVSSRRRDMNPPAAPFPSRDRQREQEIVVKEEDSPPEDESNDLVRTHHDLASKILDEEEVIIEAHRKQIDETMRLVKEEMEILRKFDKVEIDLDLYTERLDAILEKKIKAQLDLRNRLSQFRQALQEEENLSSSFKQKALQNRRP